MQIRSGYCQHCEAQRKVESPPFNTPKHLFWTILTVGLWFPFWMYFAFLSPRRWRCATCGNPAT